MLTSDIPLTLTQQYAAAYNPPCRISLQKISDLHLKLQLSTKSLQQTSAADMQDQRSKYCNYRSRDNQPVLTIDACVFKNSSLLM